MSSSVTLLTLLLLLLLVRGSRSIILCDEGCVNAPNATDLDICMKDTDPDKVPLFLMGLFPCNVPDFRGRGLTVAGQMAIRAVRANTSILQDYRLELSFSNTMCERIAGVRAFIDQLREESTLNVTRHMIIGPGCSTGAVTIAETAPFYHLTQISYTATSITLSDKRRFPTFLRTISSDNASIAIIGAFLREFDWENIAIITLRNELFLNLTEVMRDSFTGMGVNVTTEGLSFNTPADGEVFAGIIQQLNVSGARIVLLNVFEDSGRQLLCYAYRKGMTYPRYLFITYYWWSEGWVLDPLSDCTVDEIVRMTNRSIAVDYFSEPLPDEMNDPTDVGLTPSQFWTNFLSNISALNYPANEALRQAGYVYDAIWAAAFALDQADRQLKAGELEGRSSLRDFRYSEDGINRLILNAARNANFRGVTGPVSFNEFGDREPTGEIYQFLFPGGVVYTNESTIPKFPTFQPFAIVNKDNSGLEFVNGHNRATVFPNGVPLATEELFISIVLFIIMTVLSSVGIVFAVACIVFNLACRNKRVVKLTSPFLNVVTIIGAIFFYVDVILFGIDENLASFAVVDQLCQVRIWISTIGFSLFFGPILAKAFRVYYIFRSVQLKKKPIKDWILLTMIFVLVVIDVVFLIVVSLDIYRLRLNVKLFPREDGEVPLVVDNCSSEASQYWIPFLLAYKAVYLLIGLLLAVQTYSVKIKELRDSKLIAFSVFVIFVICAALTVIGFEVVDSPNAFYGLLGSFVLSLITGVLVLLFIPRMVELWRNPSGEVNVTSVHTKSKNSPADSLSSADAKKIAELKNIITSLKADIESIKRKSALKELSLSAPVLNKDMKGSTDDLLSPSSARSLGGGGEKTKKKTKKGVDVDVVEMSASKEKHVQEERKSSDKSEVVETELNNNDAGNTTNL